MAYDDSPYPQFSFGTSDTTGSPDENLDYDKWMQANGLTNSQQSQDLNLKSGFLDGLLGGLTDGTLDGSTGGSNNWLGPSIIAGSGLFSNLFGPAAQQQTLNEQQFAAQQAQQKIQNAYNQQALAQQLEIAKIWHGFDPYPVEAAKINAASNQSIARMQNAIQQQQNKNTEAANYGNLVEQGMANTKPVLSQAAGLEAARAKGQMGRDTAQALLQLASILAQNKPPDALVTRRL